MSCKQWYLWYRYAKRSKEISKDILSYLDLKHPEIGKEIEKKKDLTDELIAKIIEAAKEYTDK